jgi:hypothetical protein
VQVLLRGGLPKAKFEAQMALDVVAYWQQRNLAAYGSHRKRRISQLSQLDKVSL